MLLYGVNCVLLYYYSRVRNIFHVRCMCYIINLIVQSIFLDIKKIIVNVRDLYRFIGNFTVRIRLYKQTSKRFNVGPKKMRDNIEYRWNSMYLILHAAILYWNVLDIFVSFFFLIALTPIMQLKNMIENDNIFSKCSSSILFSHCLFFGLLLSHNFTCSLFMKLKQVLVSLLMISISIPW